MKFLKPRLKLSHTVTKSDDGTIAIGELAVNSYLVRNAPDEFLQLLLLLDGSRTFPRIIRDLNRIVTLSESEVSKILDKLTKANLLDEGASESQILSRSETERYDRQQIQFSAVEKEGLPGFTYQERIKAQTVSILGMGGWGTWTALNLALSGFGKIRIVDGDFVELSNLNRQVLYDDSSIGKSKVSAAASALNRINPNVIVDPVEEFIEPDDIQIERILDGSTLIMLCWANQSHFVKNTAEEKIHKYAFDKGIPIIEIAGDPFDISVGPTFLNDGDTPCLRCVRPQMQKLWWGADSDVEKLRKTNVKYQHVRKVNAWQSAPSLSAVTGLASEEAIKIATGYQTPSLPGKRLNISLQTYNTSLDEFKKSDCCEWCGG